MRDITVLSGCQTYGLVDAMQLLLPDFRVSGFDASRLFTDQRDNIRTHTRNSEFVFSAVFPASFDEFSPENLPELNANAAFVPQFEFPGLHPDIVYVKNAEGLWAQGPMSDYHSNIALACYLAGLDESRTASLYNHYVFGQLDYFDYYAPSRGEALATFSRYGIDLAGSFEAWERNEAPFMYSTNHPASRVLFDIAARALTAAGFRVPPDRQSPHLLPDRLAHSFVLPVFPEIARRFGFVGTRFFRPAGPDLTRAYDLKTYVGRCFESYRGQDLGGWTIPERTRRSAERIAALTGAGFG